MMPASAKLTNIKPNARWRAGFSRVPSIPAGCTIKRKVNALFQQLLNGADEKV
jgi:hypothetical protein